MDVLALEGRAQTGQDFAVEASVVGDGLGLELFLDLVRDADGRWRKLMTVGLGHVVDEI